MPVVAYAPFKYAEAITAGFARERIDVNRAEKIIPQSLAADAMDLTTCTAWTDEMGMAPRLLWRFTCCVNCRIGVGVDFARASLRQAGAVVCPALRVAG